MRENKKVDNLKILKINANRRKNNYNLKRCPMRRLPNKRTKKHNLIIKAVEDYFGETNPQERKSITKIALWLINRRKGVSLTEEEEEIKETIKVNLQDKVYASALTDNPL